MITSVSYVRSLTALPEPSTYANSPFYKNILIFGLNGDGATNVTKIGIGAEGLNTSGPVGGPLTIIGY